MIMDKDEVVRFLVDHGYYSPWKAEISHDRFGYWIAYSAGLVDGTTSPWRPTLRWALWSARRGVDRRNRRRAAVSTWTVEGDR